jgi:phosphopantothenoylcysteine decarboxylase/phosphopantothenate--cysteine ligase
MRVLITAGPTREPIDDVRFISNKSSGRMGAALAGEALRLGHRVTLVLGPTDIRPPKVRTIRVETTAEMRDAVLRELAKTKHDVFVSAAAVADYTVRKKAGKIKSGGGLALKLAPTPKIVDNVKRKHPRLFVVGFKAEHGIGVKRLVESAKRRLNKAGLDLIVANDVSNGIFGSDENEVWIIDGGGVVEKTGRRSKRAIAKIVWRIISERVSSVCAPTRRRS